MKQNLAFKLTLSAAAVCSVFAFSVSNRPMHEDKFTAAAEIAASDVKPDGHTKSFKDYLALFPKHELPYTLGEDELFGSPKERAKEVNEDYSEENPKGVAINTDYAKYCPDVEGGRYSRMGPNRFVAEALLTTNENFAMVVYSSSRPWSRRAGSYILQTYDWSGNMIDKMQIAGECYREDKADLMLSHIDKTNRVRIDFGQRSYDDTYKAPRIISTEVYAINAAGKFEKLGVQQKTPAPDENDVWTY